MYEQEISPIVEKAGGVLAKRCVFQEGTCRRVILQWRAQMIECMSPEGPGCCSCRPFYAMIYAAVIAAVGSAAAGLKVGARGNRNVSLGFAPFARVSMASGLVSGAVQLPLLVNVFTFPSCRFYYCP